MINIADEECPDPVISKSDPYVTWTINDWQYMFYLKIPWELFSF